MAEKETSAIAHVEKSSTSSHSDLEKTTVPYERRDVESDRVTLKTWAVVIVSCLSPCLFLTNFSGSGSIIRILLLACPILQHHSRSDVCLVR